MADHGSSGPAKSQDSLLGAMIKDFCWDADLCLAAIVEGRLWSASALDGARLILPRFLGERALLHGSHFNY